MARFVLIGGGENGREGTKYETQSIDKEIVKITNRKNPNFLFLAHGNDYEESYYNVMKKIYQNKFNCTCDILTKEEVFSLEIANEKLKLADIIYIGGGNTLKMINIWKRSGFSNILRNYITEDKTLCGISAGAIGACPRRPPGNAGNRYSYRIDPSSPPAFRPGKYPGMDRIG